MPRVCHTDERVWRGTAGNVVLIEKGMVTRAIRCREWCDNELTVFMGLAVMAGRERVMSHMLPYMRSVRHRDGGGDKISER